MTGNHDLADRAAALARESPRGSAERRAALCAAVVLDTTRSVAAARAALAESDNFPWCQRSAGETI